MPEGNPVEDESQNTFLAQDLGLFFRVFTFLAQNILQSYDVQL